MNETTATPETATGDVAPNTPSPDAGAATQSSQAAPASPFDDLPDELRGWVDNKGWGRAENPVEAAIRAHRELEKFTGVPADKLVRIPDDPAKMGEVYDRLGRPESAEAYTVKIEGEAKDAMFDRLAATAHSAGLTDTQFGALQEEFASAATEMMTARQEQIAARLETWRADNPTDFHNVQTLMQTVGIGEEEMAEALQGEASAFYSVLAKAASRMSEGQAVGGDVASDGFQMTPAQAKAKVEEMNADPEFRNRLFHDDPSVRAAASREREPFMRLASQQGMDDSDRQRLQNEVARLRAQARTPHGGALR